MWWKRSGGHADERRGQQGERQMDVALEALVVIERRCGFPAQARPRTMTVRGWEAIAEPPDASAAVARLPRDERHGAPREPKRPVPTTSSATVVRLGKFSTADAVRGRAFYLDRDPALTVKFVIAGASRQRQLEREIAARSALGASGHLPAPLVVGSGTTPGLCYLAEEVVWGTHAANRELKQLLALDLVTELLTAHRAAGVVDEPVALHKATRRRLGELTTATSWIPAGEPSARFISQAERLITDDTAVPVGWCHGDLGFSNVIVDGSGVPRLIDWEHAGRMPVAADLAKLATMSPDQRGVADHIMSSAGPEDIGVRPGRRSVPDQLALMVLRELSWWQRRRTTAVAAGRGAAFERGVQRRLRLFDFLCSDGAAGRQRPARRVRT